MQFALETDGLGKTYRSFKKEPGLAGSLKALVRREVVPVVAVRDLNFRVGRGEFVGLLGPNGAGKTTTLKMLTGLIAPTAGTARALGGFDPSRRDPAYLRRIGMVMGQRNQLNPDLPAMDSFRLAQAIYAIPEDDFRRRMDQCVDMFGIRDKILTPVRKLSLGERMKMELILAILHGPELLFLDEPTIGLDFNAARQIREFLARTNRELGITVILTSHYTRDIEELCRRVIIINHGTIVYDGTLSGMDERIKAQKIVTFVFGNDRAARAAVDVVKVMTEGVGGLRLHRDTGGDFVTQAADGLGYSLSVDIPASHAAASLRDILSRINADDIIDLKAADRPLDDIFSEIYRQQGHDQ